MTKENNGWFLYFLVAVFGFLISYLFVEADVFNTPSEDAMRLFLTEKYNFTEEECIGERYWIVNAMGWQKAFQHYPSFDDVDTVRLVAYKSLGYMPNYEIVPVAMCSHYCHTTQVKGGKECRTEERDYVLVKDYLLDDQGNPAPYERKEYLPYPFRYNVTICIPTYKNVTGFCADAEEVKKVRDLIK